MINIYGKEEITAVNKMRALTWIQPFASLMVWGGKQETRNRATNVRGLVLICAGKTPYAKGKLLSICGTWQFGRIFRMLGHDKMNITGKALAVGNLVDCRRMQPSDEDICFVKYNPALWVWVFEDIREIEPIEFKGKQGWSILTDEQKKLIKYK